MGIGPVFAIPCVSTRRSHDGVLSCLVLEADSGLLCFSCSKVLQSVGITKDDVDLWEINEAFSSM